MLNNVKQFFNLHWDMVIIGQLITIIVLFFFLSMYGRQLTSCEKHDSMVVEKYNALIDTNQAVNQLNEELKNIAHSFRPHG